MIMKYVNMCSSKKKVTDISLVQWDVNIQKI